MNKEYLGDSVYAQVHEDTGALILTTENGYQPSNMIILEDEVMISLISYLKRNYKFKELCK